MRIKETNRMEQQKNLTDNEKKKKYLSSYLNTARRINRIEEELAEIKLMKICPSMNNDGMPHGSSGAGDLSGYASQLDTLESQLLTERYNRIRIYTEIRDRIEEMADGNEKDVLFYRYIKGMAWWEIAEKMRYTDRWVLKLHGKALAHFKI